MTPSGHLPSPPKFGPEQTGPQSLGDWRDFYRFLVTMWQKTRDSTTAPEVRALIPQALPGASEQRTLASSIAFQAEASRPAVPRSAVDLAALETYLPRAAVQQPAVDAAAIEAYSPFRIQNRLDELGAVVAMLAARPYYSLSQIIAQAQVTVGANGGVTPLTITGSPGLPPTGLLYNATPVSAVPSPGDPLDSIGNVVVVTGTGIYYEYTSIQGVPAPTWYAIARQGAQFYDTRANRIANYDPTKYPLGTTFTETDTTLIYTVQLVGGVNVWLFTSGYWSRTQAQVPTVGATLGVNDNALRIRTSDTGHAYIWNGTVWHFDSDSAGYKLLWTTGGLPFGQTSSMWGLCNGSTYSVAQDDGTTASVSPGTIATTYLRL